LDDFTCGDHSLDHWLQTRALDNERSGATRTFITTNTANRVAGYYSLAAGSLAHREAPGRLRRNMPEPLPMVVLARLAVSVAYQGRHLGADLVVDAVLRSINASRAVGIRGMLVNAINDSAAAFYLHLGFRPTPSDPLTLVATLQDLQATVASVSDS
jgi:GNAT superfamily N-acetyltransferase